MVFLCLFIFERQVDGRTGKTLNVAYKYGCEECFSGIGSVFEITRSWFGISVGSVSLNNHGFGLELVWVCGNNLHIIIKFV